jgi:hypothetical protein
METIQKPATLQEGSQQELPIFGRESHLRIEVVRPVSSIGRLAIDDKWHMIYRVEIDRIEMTGQ